MRRLVVLLLAAGLLAACGDSSSPTTATTTAASTAASGCSDEALTMIVQQQIGTLNALTTDISRDWFLTRAKQAEGVARAKTDLDQLKTQQKALEACTGATAKQQALIDPALAAITDVRAFAQATLAIVKGRTITQAQKALRKERPKIEQLTKRLTESLAALSTQWEVWKHDHQGS